MSNRDTILGRIRAAIGSNGAELRQKAAEARIRKHPAGIVPKGPASPAAIRELFVKKARESASTVEIVDAGGESDAIATWLRSQNLGQRLRMGTDRRLARIRWPKIGGPERDIGPSDGKDPVTLSHALAGIAETGTLILASGPHNPTTLNFLGENHIVLLDERNIVLDHENVWKRLRRRFGSRNLPRALNLITGPSRSADIEQTLILGAHGPIRLHILLVRS